MSTEPVLLKLALPKGRMQDSVVALLAEAGVKMRLGLRSYRPNISLPNLDTKILKPQNIIEMLQHGTRDFGIAGADWVAELGADIVEVADLELDAVRIVAAAPKEYLVDGKLPLPGGKFRGGKLRIVGEMKNLAARWIQTHGIDAEFIRSYGTTEVFPPEDGDCIIDIVQSGDTLRANNLEICDTLMHSTTRVYSSKAAWADPAKRARIEEFAMILKSVLDARKRVMLELNVAAAQLDAVVAILPSMGVPTVAHLHHDAGFAVKSAVPRKDVVGLISKLKAAGAKDIVTYGFSQIIP
jgi:ATP phosphoribosyltransferase